LGNAAQIECILISVVLAKVAKAMAVSAGTFAVTDSFV
jgi:hypothetical protein